MIRQLGKLSFNGRQWVIERCEPHVALKVKALFTKVCLAARPPYYFANTGEVCKDLEWFIQRYPLEMSEGDKELLLQKKDEFEAQIEKMETIFSNNYKPSPHNMVTKLRVYQSQFVDLALINKRLLNGDQLGLGKTASAIGVFSHHETLPALVVVQTHLVPQWLDEIQKFLGAKAVQIKGTTPYQLPTGSIYVIRYSCLLGWIDYLAEGFFKTVVFDECQELRCYGSQKYSAAKTAADAAQYVIGLSATPIYNHGDEMWNLMNVIRPGFLGDKDEFCREWCKGWDSKVVNDPRALGTYLRENFLMIRRTRSDVGKELPEINRIIHNVEYSEAAIDSMDSLMKQLATQVCTGTFTERGQAAREFDMRLRQITGVAKAKSVAAYVRMIVENGESVLLGGWHREVYSIWQNELRDLNPLMYTGSESPEQKERAKQAFIAKKSPILIMSLRSGAGTDGLQKAASIAVIGELDWSPGVHEQFIGRLNRDGQSEPVTSIFLVCNGGSDPAMTELLGLKSSQAKGINDPASGPELVNSDDKRIKQMAEHFLKKRTQVPNKD